MCDWAGTAKRMLAAGLAVAAMGCAGPAAPSDAREATSPGGTSAVASNPPGAAVAPSSSRTGATDELSDAQKAEVAALTQRAAALEQRIIQLVDMLGGDWDGEKIFEWDEVIVDEDGEPRVVRREMSLTQEEAGALHKELDQRLATVAEMSKLDQLDLQQMYEDYQSGDATLTAIIDQQHDDFNALLDNLTANDDDDG